MPYCSVCGVYYVAQLAMCVCVHRIKSSYKTLIVTLMYLFDLFLYFVARGEASHLLFQPGYLHVLKQMALSGQLQMYNIRSIAWRVSGVALLCGCVWGVVRCGCAMKFIL